MLISKQIGFPHIKNWCKTTFLSQFFPSGIIPEDPLLNECPEYDIKPFDDEAPALEIRIMQITSSFPFQPGLLWPGVAAPDRVLSMGQVEHIMCWIVTVI